MVPEHEVYTPGTLLTVYRTRQDGLVRVVIKDLSTGNAITLYMTADERVEWADAFAGNNPSVLPKVRSFAGKRKQNGV